MYSVIRPTRLALIINLRGLSLVALNPPPNILLTFYSEWLKYGMNRTFYRLSLSLQVLEYMTR